MPSEFLLDLCFLQESGERELFRRTIEEEMKRLFAGQAKWNITCKTVEKLDVAMVDINGLAAGHTEEEVLSALESRMNSGCWAQLGGYRLQVIPKEDAGSCRLPNKGGDANGQA